MLALKAVILVTALYLMYAESAVVVRDDVINHRPIIGILSQEQSKYFHTKYPENYTSYIAASYVKNVEASGARVVPIMIGRDRDYYRDLMSKINGVLFPGGATYFNQSDGYADAGEHIYHVAMELNDAGSYFPVFGTCLGFELLIILASGRGKVENREKCYSFKNSRLNFTKDCRRSKMYRDAPEYVVDILSTEDVTANAHQFCILDSNLEKYNLKNDWLVTSHSKDEDGLAFVASVEHKRYPFYGVQFHPEKVAFEWKASKHYPHSLKAVQANRYFMDFFVEECRRSGHKFPSHSEENRRLIYNYRPEFTGLLGSSYEQCYFFEPRETVIGKERSYYEELLSKINGVLFPDGATYFNQSDGYADAGEHNILSIAKELNDAGDYFPIFGTCLGFQLIMILESGREKVENRGTCWSFRNLPLHFTEDFRSSKMFSEASADVVDILANENVTVNAHQFCIFDENLKAYNLNDVWQPTSYSVDDFGLYFIATIENKR